MSFLKRLFGGNASEEEAAATQVEHNGFLVRATPYKDGGQYQACGIVSKEIEGVVKEHRFVRADRFASLEDAVKVSLSKGKQLVDEQGERIFG